MPVVSLTIPDEVYRQLRDEAARLGKSPQAMVGEWLAERLARLSITSTHLQMPAESALRYGIQIGLPGGNSAPGLGGSAGHTADTPPKESDSDRKKADQALRAAGLLTGLGADLRRLADPAVRLEDVNAALARAGGKPLSEIVLEQRGPKG